MFVRLSGEHAISTVCSVPAHAHTFIAKHSTDKCRHVKAWCTAVLRLPIKARFSISLYTSHTNTQASHITHIAWLQLIALLYLSVCSVVIVMQTDHQINIRTCRYSNVHKIAFSLCWTHSCLIFYVWSYLYMCYSSLRTTVIDTDFI